MNTYGERRQNPQGLGSMHRSHGLGGDIGALESLYGSWANTYEADVADEGYVGPRMCAMLSGQAGGPVSRVLDVGCGTGLVGRELKRTHPDASIDGADLSVAMATQAARSGAYSEVVAGFDLNKELPSHWVETYDLVVCCGTFTNGHVGPGRVRELVRAVRRGGSIIVSVRRNFSRELGFKETMEALEVADEAVVETEVLNGPYIGEEGADYWRLARP